MEHLRHMKSQARQGVGGSDKQEPKPFLGGLQRDWWGRPNRHSNTSGGGGRVGGSFLESWAQ